MESPKATRRGRVRRKKGVGRGRNALRRSMVTAITAEAAQSIDFPSQGLNQSIILWTIFASAIVSGGDTCPAVVDMTSRKGSPVPMQPGFVPPRKKILRGSMGFKIRLWIASRPGVFPWRDGEAPVSTSRLCSAWFAEFDFQSLGKNQTRKDGTLDWVVYWCSSRVLDPKPGVETLLVGYIINTTGWYIMESKVAVFPF